MMSKATMFKTLVGTTLAALAVAAGAQTFPTKTVRIVIGFPPGGGIDSVTRIMGPKMSEILKQPVVVENKPGGNALPAMGEVAKSSADGHTLFVGTSGNLAMSPIFFPNASVRVDRDFVAVAQTASLPFVLVANPQVPAQNARELIAWIKANPGKVNYSSSGNGSTLHLAGELFNDMAGTRATHIPYKGSAPSIADLIGGHVQFAFDSPSLTMPQVKAGKLRALGQTALKPVASLPGVPPIADSLPGFEVLNWYGMVAPKGTPATAIRTIADAVKTTLADPDIKARIAKLGIDPVTTDPNAFGNFMKSETTKWGKVIAQAKIKVN
jgi:tripartite-type tricarboxylate transporter receptor subunit TctC